MKKIRDLTALLPHLNHWPYRVQKLHPQIGKIAVRFGAPLLNPDLWGKRITLDELELLQGSLCIRRPHQLEEWVRGGLSPSFFAAASDWLLRSLLAQHLAYRVHQMNTLKSQVELDRPIRETVFVRCRMDSETLNKALWDLQKKGRVELESRLLILNKRDKHLGYVDLVHLISGPLALTSSTIGAAK